MSDLILSISRSIASVDGDLILLIVIILAGLIVVRGLYGSAELKRKDSGMGKDALVVSVDGSKSLAVRHYVSEMQGLAGRPDALISENGFIIPVERKPLARKIRDRYVAQLLVYMRLVEEFEGRRPPYGYLILGPSCRSFKIENSLERQAWLQGIIDDMRQILDGGVCVAAPHIRKCIKCGVRNFCEFNITAGDNKIESRNIA
ncbi:MAG: Dna2/Cas4 domain-containing protein [SAR324 cluster bacterium]|uniref:Dna2/Cas4 domain-containing protein n=1 Tax=SAR324 cluster bacterium TaxID=2024889 RepID=A0A7X9FPP1_9DELT|nr:Dna2/Cas4 domain-containing protein [SAR324 cluster bacterium]